MNKEELNEIIRKAKEELNEEDLKNIMDTIDENETSYLEENNIEKILKEIIHVLEEYEIKDKEEKINKLLNYRYVDEIHEIHKGKNIKFLRKKDKKLLNGGLVLDIKFLNNGTHILCKNFKGINQYKFDEYLCFQRMSNEELLILMANDLIE